MPDLDCRAAVVLFRLVLTPSLFGGYVKVAAVAILALGPAGVEVALGDALPTHSITAVARCRFVDTILERTYSA